MSDRMLKLKDELNEKLSLELNFERDIKRKALEKINKYEEKRPSFYMQKIMSGVVLTAAILGLSLFTINQLMGTSQSLGGTASQSSKEDVYTYSDPDYGFKLELPSYIEHHIRTFDSENGRSFYFTESGGDFQLLFHIDIYKKSASNENTDIAGRTLIKQTEQHLYYTSDINENIKIMSSAFSKDNVAIMEKFATDFQSIISTLKPIDDAALGWSIKTVANHNEQLKKAVEEISLLLDSEYKSNDLEAYIEANETLYKNMGQNYSKSQILIDLKNKFEMRNKGQVQTVAEVSPYEINSQTSKVIVTINTQLTEGELKIESNRYLATYELMEGNWTKIDWKNID
jgi:hypothetical protein